MAMPLTQVNAASIAFQIESKNAHAGETVNLGVNISGNPGIKSMKGAFILDPGLEFIRTTTGMFDSSMASSNGALVKVAAASASAITADGTMLNILIKVPDDANVGDRYTIVWVEDAEGDDIYAIKNDGSKVEGLTTSYGLITIVPLPYTLVSITSPAAISDVANGTAISSINLPSSVVIDTGNGGPTSAAVTWDRTSATPSYNASSTKEQTFTINGTVYLPENVINRNEVSLNTSIKVTVNKGAKVSANDTASTKTQSNQIIQTGDATNVWMWIGILAMALVVAGVAVRNIVKQRKSK